MTLFNTDKSSGSRGAPSINAPDVHANPKAHSTNSISPRAEGTQSAGKVTTKDSRIIANDGSNNIGLFGFDDAGNMVVKVAKTGFDANSATDDQLIFNSSQDVLKVAEVGTATIASTVCSAGVNTTITGVYTFTNSYATPPAILGFTTYGGTTTNGIWPGGGGSALQGNLFPLSMATGTNVVIQVAGLQSYFVNTTSATFRLVVANGSGSSYTTPQYTIKVYVLQESAS